MVQAALTSKRMEWPAAPLLAQVCWAWLQELQALLPQLGWAWHHELQALLQVGWARQGESPLPWVGRAWPLRWLQALLVQLGLVRSQLAGQMGVTGQQPL